MYRKSTDFFSIILYSQNDAKRVSRPGNSTFFYYIYSQNDAKRVSRPGNSTFFYSQNDAKRVSRPGNSCFLLYYIILYYILTKLHFGYKYVYLLSTLSSTSRHKKIVTRGFLLLFFFNKNICSTIYRFPEAKFFIILLIAINFLVLA